MSFFSVPGAIPLNPKNHGKTSVVQDFFHLQHDRNTQLVDTACLIWGRPISATFFW